MTLLKDSPKDVVDFAILKLDDVILNKSHEEVTLTKEGKAEIVLKITLVNTAYHRGSLKLRDLPDKDKDEGNANSVHPPAVLARESSSPAVLPSKEAGISSIFPHISQILRRTTTLVHIAASSRHLPHGVPHQPGRRDSSMRIELQIGRLGSLQSTFDEMGWQWQMGTRAKLPESLPSFRVQIRGL